MSKNKYGLSRHINETLKEVIRKRDGFGCVICGLGIYTFEHYDPKFKDAKYHDENGICLLCFQHQGETSKGILSKTTISDAVINAKCNQRGYTNAFFDLQFPITVQLGNILIRAEGKQDHPILVLGKEEIIKVNAKIPEELFQFSAVFKDQYDNVSLKIVMNEWTASVQNWDIKQVGSRLSIINELQDSKIVIRADPPHGLVFEELDLYNNGTKIHFEKNGKLFFKKKTGESFQVSVDSPQQIRSLNFNF